VRRKILIYVFLLILLTRTGFHLSHRLTEKFPESCLLIILGLIVGALLYVTHLAEQKAYVLNSDTFFLFLLPVGNFHFFSFSSKYICFLLIANYSRSWIFHAQSSILR